VEEEWRSLSEGEQELVRKALAAIDEDPIEGAPLLGPLKGLWSYRVEHLRIVYRVMAEARLILVLSIGRAEKVLS
jgi:mRNA-degrading endonuclease RelE of RelBE toxin-antitoxin system